MLDIYQQAEYMKIYSCDKNLIHIYPYLVKLIYEPEYNIWSGLVYLSGVPKTIGVYSQYNKLLLTCGFDNINIKNSKLYSGQLITFNKLAFVSKNAR